MPYADHHGIRIHYETEGQGPPLVLHHWSLATLESWYDYGYVSALKDDYRLVLLDARGHGASDKPHRPEAYDLQKRVEDVVAKPLGHHLLGPVVPGALQKYDLPDLVRAIAPRKVD